MLGFGPAEGFCLKIRYGHRLGDSGLLKWKLNERSVGYPPTFTYSESTRTNPGPSGPWTKVGLPLVIVAFLGRPRRLADSGDALYHSKLTFRLQATMPTTDYDEKSHLHRSIAWVYGLRV